MNITETKSIRFWRWWALGGFALWFLETAWFGFNLTAQSPAEHFWDSFTLSTMVIGIVMFWALRFWRKQRWTRFAAMAMDTMFKVGSVSDGDDGEQKKDMNSRIQAAALAADLLLKESDQRWE